MLRRLRSPHRNNHIQDTSANTVDQTRANHERRILRGSLQRGAEDGPDASDEQRLQAAHLLADPPTEEAADECAEVVD